MPEKLICIIGPDGVGKTSQITTLISELNNGIDKYEYRWLRFHHLISLPLLAYARLIGCSDVQILENGKKIGYHYFSRSVILSKLYPLTLLIDTIIFTTIKLYVPLFLQNKKIICDRFTYDTIVDLMLSLESQTILDSKIVNLFTQLIPNKSQVILLLGDAQNLRSRRDDVKHDKSIERKIEYYNKISQKFHLTVLDANGTFKEVHNNLLMLVCEREKYNESK